MPCNAPGQLPATIDRPGLKSGMATAKRERGQGIEGLLTQPDTKTGHIFSDTDLTQPEILTQPDTTFSAHNCTAMQHFACFYEGITVTVLAGWYNERQP